MEVEREREGDGGGRVGKGSWGEKRTGLVRLGVFLELRHELVKLLLALLALLDALLEEVGVVPRAQLLLRRGEPPGERRSADADGRAAVKSDTKSAPGFFSLFSLLSLFSLQRPRRIFDTSPSFVRSHGAVRERERCTRRSGERAGSRNVPDQDLCPQPPVDGLLRRHACCDGSAGGRVLPCGVFCARANREGVGRRCVPRFCRPSVRLSGRGAPVPIVQPPLRFSCFAVASLTFFLVSVWSSSSSL